MFVSLNNPSKYPYQFMAKNVNQRLFFLIRFWLVSGLLFTPVGLDANFQGTALSRQAVKKKPCRSMLIPNQHAYPPGNIRELTHISHLSKGKFGQSSTLWSAGSNGGMWYSSQEFVTIQRRPTSLNLERGIPIRGTNLPINSQHKNHPPIIAVTQGTESV